MDTGGVPFIKVWGSNGSPQWSPDGSKIAFVSSRSNHSLTELRANRDSRRRPAGRRKSADAMNLWRVATREHVQWALGHGYRIAALHRDLAESRAFYLTARDAREVTT